MSLFFFSFINSVKAEGTWADLPAMMWNGLITFIYLMAKNNLKLFIFLTIISNITYRYLNYLKFTKNVYIKNSLYSLVKILNFLITVTFFIFGLSVTFLKKSQRDFYTEKNPACEQLDRFDCERLVADQKKSRLNQEQSILDRTWEKYSPNHQHWPSNEDHYDKIIFGNRGDVGSILITNLTETPILFKLYEIFNSESLELKRFLFIRRDRSSVFGDLSQGDYEIHALFLSNEATFKSKVFSIKPNADYYNRRVQITLNSDIFENWKKISLDKF